MGPPGTDGAPTAITGTAATEPAGPQTTPASEPQRDWGTVRVGRRDLPIRGVVIVACVAIWLGVMLFATGVSGLVALWTAAAFFIPLVLIASLTRTVPLRLFG